jgi:hypothetical protein
MWKRPFVYFLSSAYTFLLLFVCNPKLSFYDGFHRLLGNISIFMDATNLTSRPNCLMLASLVHQLAQYDIELLEKESS